MFGGNASSSFESGLLARWRGARYAAWRAGTNSGEGPRPTPCPANSQLYALHNFLYAVGSDPAGALADRYGKRYFLLFAYALAATMNLVLILAAPSFAALVIVFVLAGAAYALQQSLERAIAAAGRAA